MKVQVGLHLIFLSRKAVSTIAAAKKLTPKQKAFVSEYLIDKNATQAAFRAGYSKKTAYSMGKKT